MDEAEQDAASSLPAPLVSVPTNRGNPPPVTSLRDGSVPATCSPVREVVAKEGYTSTGDTKARVSDTLLDVEEDREE